MVFRRSSEEYLAELENILRSYGASEASGQKLSQEEAVAQLKRLGFTAGEALKLLRQQSR